MKFRTEIQLPPASIEIDYASRILSMGSCFADRMGSRLQEAKIPALTNPLGIIYNPISLCKVFDLIINPDQFPHIQQSPLGLWHSFDLHSKLSEANQPNLQSQIKASLEQTRLHFAETNLLILTFGTAYAFKRKDNGQVVANCHKYPADFFEKVLLSVGEIVKNCQILFTRLKAEKPDLQILLTVSPVRHIKEGLSNNMLSKSILRLACQQLCDTFDHVTYFPAYEIMLDDLRDYRYYQDDLIHPNSFAEQYIWERFVEHFFTHEAKALLKKWQKLQQAINHRPLQPQTEAYRAFLEKLLKQLEEIKSHINCEKEIEEVRGRVGAL